MTLDEAAERLSPAAHGQRLVRSRGASSPARYSRNPRRCAKEPNRSSNRAAYSASTRLPLDKSDAGTGDYQGHPGRMAPFGQAGPSARTPLVTRRSCARAKIWAAAACAKTRTNRSRSARSPSGLRSQAV